MENAPSLSFRLLSSRMRTDLRLRRDICLVGRGASGQGSFPAFAATVERKHNRKLIEQAGAIFGDGFARHNRYTAITCLAYQPRSLIGPGYVFTADDARHLDGKDYIGTDGLIGCRKATEHDGIEQTRFGAFFRGDGRCQSGRRADFVPA